MGLLLLTFFTMQGVIVPSILQTENLAQAVSIRQAKKVDNIYNIKPLEKFPGVFSFDYKFNPVQKLKNAVPFDVSIKQFDETKVSGLENYGRIRDDWGYPVRENAYMKGGVKAGASSKKTSLNPFKATEALAYDPDPNTIGIYNCRANTSVAGYFKAYFEDVALNTNAGYDDQLHGEARRQEACKVLQDISELIMLDETNVTPDILFMTDSGMPAGALAAASSYSGYYAVGPDNGSLHRHIISRQNPTPGAGNFDAFIMTGFNGIQWDVDSTLNPSTYDFYTVLYHEAMHALGFRGLLPAVVTSTNNVHNYGTLDSFSYRDTSLTDPFFNQLTGILNVPIGAPSPWFVTNNVVYRGVKNMPSASPDGIRPVYSPISWEEGSSLSHFDMSRAPGQTYIMNPSIGTNTERDIHSHEKQVLCHLGYQVEGLSGCADATPWAGDDSINIDYGDPVCINPLQNDQGFEGQISGYFMNPTELEAGDSMVFYSGTDCNGSVLPTFSNAKSFMFDPIASGEMRLLNYKIKDVSSNRISNNAQIMLSACDVSADEYLCNGGFEKGFIDTASISSIQVQSCPSPFPYLCSLWGSPDIYSRDFNFYSPWLFAGPSDTHTGAPNDRYLYGGGGTSNISAGDELYRSERAYLKSKTVLPPGEYVLSWYGVYTGNIEQIGSASVNAYITYEVPVTPTGATVQYMPNVGEIHVNVPVTLVGSANVTNPLNWQHYQTNLIIPDNGLQYQYLILEPKRVVIEDINYISFVNAFDDVSLRRIGDAPTTLGVSGIVYLDVNQDGIKQSNENGLAGVPVAIFGPGEEIPFQTIQTQDFPNLGKYNFAGLPNGLYNLALEGESLYGTVTEPSANNIISGYSHAQQVTVSGGNLSTGNDFGVVLNENNSGHADIQIKKTLIDPTLSLFDRYITWRIIVQNIGPNNATNILIKEIIPAGLVYHSNVTPIPNGYDSSAHMLSIPALSAGGQTYIDITMKVPNSKKVCGTKTNLAVLHHLDQTDTNLGNNQGQAAIVLPRCPIVDAPSKVEMR
jgi:uncharacterized repeat protein (TIGR01451 family)